jgi:GrpB-like predicted nucleotidyltransferase (UPF0157 family)
MLSDPTGWPEFRITVVDHDPGWPARFEQEAALLDDAIGTWVTGGIHHVGSTAVPGLAAKPVIDVLAGVVDLETAKACFEPLSRLQYLYAPILADQMHWFCKPDPATRTHHLHLVPTDSPAFRSELAFRDYLRAHHETADDYETLKWSLAARFEHDRQAYTQGKTGFIVDVLRRTGHL